MSQAPAVIVGRPEPDVRPGTVIADKYRIERELGRGGFGVVVRARHLALDQPVAIKVLTPGQGTELEWAVDAERFRREAQATAALRGDHVVRILDADVLASGAPYIVMEHLEGETLHVATYARGPLHPQEAVDHAIQILAALAEAHAAGVVHRDLKPANVFLVRGADGRPIVKVLDFGVSKMSEGDKSITRTGAVLGTVAYMAPEQLLDSKRADARADLWSVGVILYESLTKALPFGPATSPNVVSTILRSPPTPLSAVRPGLPPGLDAVLLRSLEKDPERRYQTASELAFALAPFASPRARFALDVIVRYPPPAGPAAPALPRRAHASVPAPAPAAPPRTSLGVGGVLAIIAGALLLFGGTAFGLLQLARLVEGREPAPRIAPQPVSPQRP